MAQDFEAKFLKYGTLTALCCAHLLRELKGLLTLFLVAWAAGMITLLREMIAHKNRDVRNGVKACEPFLLRIFERRYDLLS